MGPHLEVSLAGLLGTSKCHPGTCRCTGQKQSYGVLKMYIFLSELWQGNLWNQCSAKESAVLSSATKMVYAYLYWIRMNNPDTICSYLQSADILHNSKMESDLAKQGDCFTVQVLQQPRYLCSSVVYFVSECSKP